MVSVQSVAVLVDHNGELGAVRSMVVVAAMSVSRSAIQSDILEELAAVEVVHVD